MAAGLGPFVHMDIWVDRKQVDQLMWALEYVLSPTSLMIFHETLTRQHIIDRAQDRFRDEGDSAVGGPWDLLTESREDIRAHAGRAPAPDHPINRETGDLEKFILTNKGRITKNALGATFSFPGATPRNQGRKAKYETAQRGKPAGFPMPDGRGGVKPSPSPTPARPVVGLDALDLVHTLGALELFVTAEVTKRVGV